ncbi:MAG: divergent polysaccharide deacetylase family protein [Pseudomonadota bacterium]
MSTRRTESPSVFKTALIHSGLAALTFAAIAGTGGAAIQLAGDPRDAGPSMDMAMFDDPNAPTDLQLKTRFAERDRASLQLAAMMPAETAALPAEPSLGIGYPQGAGPSAAVQPASAASVASDMPEGVRINGRTVFPGEALSDVMELGELPTSPLQGLHARNSNGFLPIVAEDGQTISEAYARPHVARPGQPTASIILGGLGINYTHTKSAIEELPPEVTLSFAAHARGLQTWIKRARDAGHEVLIELPLEPMEPGRVRLHAHTLKSAADASDNQTNLERILALGHGYFGVMNFQGDKFITNTDAAVDMFKALNARGVAFVEDGNLPGSTLRDAAGEAGASYSRANFVIDARIDADSMRGQLQALEAEALSSGQALGTAIAYPLTIDIVMEWTNRLEQKGIVLAPASSLQAVPAPVTRDVTMMDAPDEAAKLP